MNPKNRNLSIQNLSSSLNKDLRSMRSLKSIRTNSTHETPRIDSFISDSLSNNNFSTIVATSKNSNRALRDIIKRTNKSTLKKYLSTEPNNSIDLIINADKILKGRENKYIIYNQLVKSIYMKKEKEICLNNYKIKLMDQKRNELNTKKVGINNALKSNEKIFEQDYKNFLEFVENTNNYYKRQDYLLNKYKALIDEKDSELNKLNLQNKKLKEDIEFMVRRILTLRYYGKFIHNVFKIEFIYEKIKKIEDKNYLDVAEDIIQTYENNHEKAYDISQLDVYWLMAQINEYENNIISILNERESFKKEIIKITYDDKEELKNLKEKKEKYEIKLEMAIEDKEKFMKSITTYNNPEIMDTILDCVDELTEILKLNTSFSSTLLKERNIMNYTTICAKLIKIVEGKENEIINYIEEIENVINGKNEEDKVLIEEIIYGRKKEIKKRKLFELLKEQEEEIMKKNIQAVERAQRIVIKGRKVIDFPMIKTKKKKTKIVKDNDEGDIICYSSDDN